MPAYMRQIPASSIGVEGAARNSASVARSGLGDTRGLEVLSLGCSSTSPTKRRGALLNLLVETNRALGCVRLIEQESDQQTPKIVTHM
jgi:hypothetical protein